MEGPAASLFFRQVFVYNNLRFSRHAPVASRLAPSRFGRARESQCRNAGTYSRSRDPSQPARGPLAEKGNRVERENLWRPRRDILPAEKLREFDQYPWVTAEELRSKNRRPKRMKMLMREFIDDSLYNPTYGYFSSQVVIFDPGEPFNFPTMNSESQFHRVLGQRYEEFEDKLDEKEKDETRQLWHTPTELFRPHYAEAIARYMVTNYKVSNYPYDDLIIYEMGAGNGTFMMNVLDYIRDTDPEVYARTRYKVIEISPLLANLQTSAVNRSTALGSHADKVEIINRSIFTWDTPVPSPCFFLAFEVIDNFAHDVIRYSPHSEQPLQGCVLIDTHGELYPFFSQTIDPLAERFFRVRDVACTLPLTHPLRWSRWKRAARARLPFAGNLSEPEWLPTRLMQFFDVLNGYFPAHKLIMGDFSKLPTLVEGLGAPVVQTRYKRKTVPVTTPLVHQGYFDILFPTDFSVTESIYCAITGKFARVLSHEEFMSRWAFVEQTQCRNGDNPLLTWYKNASVLYTL